MPCTKLNSGKVDLLQTHGLQHYEYLIRQTGMLTFTSLLIVLWLTHMDLPIPYPLPYNRHRPLP